MATPEPDPSFPVLKIRATGIGAKDVTEVSLGGQTIYPVSVSLRMADREVTTATIVMEVIPDIETPVVYGGRPC